MAVPQEWPSKCVIDQSEDLWPDLACIVLTNDTLDLDLVVIGCAPCYGGRAERDSFREVTSLIDLLPSELLHPSSTDSSPCLQPCFVPAHTECTPCAYSLRQQRIRGR